MLWGQEPHVTWNLTCKPTQSKSGLKCKGHREVKHFLAICVLMGLKELRRYTDCSMVPQQPPTHDQCFCPSVRHARMTAVQSVDELVTDCIPSEEGTWYGVALDQNCRYILAG
jgi:hypothetical protein